MHEPIKRRPLDNTINAILHKHPYVATAILPSQQPGLAQAEKRLQEIHKYLTTQELSESSAKSSIEVDRFLKQTTYYYMLDDKIYKKNGNKPPLLVILDPRKQLTILTQAHDELGHRGEMAVKDLISARFYWPHQ